MATRPVSTHVHVSSLIKDPFVRSAFERADRDRSDPITVPVLPLKPVLSGGAVVRELAHV